MFQRSLLCERSCTTAVTIKARLFCFSAYTSQKLGHICSEKERDRYPERQTANRAKSSKGYSARKTDPVGERERESEREQQDSSRSAKHQSRADMKELIWCGNEPDHRVQLHLCRLSLTSLNVTHTHEKIHYSDEHWQIDHYYQ